MASDSELAGSNYSVMDPSAIFPILLSVGINELYLRTLSIQVFLQKSEEKFIYKSNIGVLHGPDFCMVAIFGEKFFLANLVILRQIANVCIC